MRLVILGASLSQQAPRRDNGAPTGYAEFLRREQAGRLGAGAILQTAYGGSRLSDGGLPRAEDAAATGAGVLRYDRLRPRGERERTPSPPWTPLFLLFLSAERKR